MSYPIENRGLSVDPWPFSMSLRWKNSEKSRICVTGCIYRPQYSPNGGVQWHLPKPWISSIGQCVQYRTGEPPWPSKMASKVGPFFCRYFVCCCPGSRWGNTEQVVAQWHRPVASQVALDMLHWAMPSVLLLHTAVAIKMANDGGAFVFSAPFFACYNCS